MAGERLGGLAGRKRRARGRRHHGLGAWVVPGQGRGRRARRGQPDRGQGGRRWSPAARAESPDVAARAVGLDDLPTELVGPTCSSPPPDAGDPIVTTCGSCRPAWRDRRRAAAHRRRRRAARRRSRRRRPRRGRRCSTWTPSPPSPSAGIASRRREIAAVQDDRRIDELDRFDWPRRMPARWRRSSRPCVNGPRTSALAELERFAGRLGEPRRPATRGGRGAHPRDRGQADARSDRPTEGRRRDLAGRAAGRVSARALRPVLTADRPCRARSGSPPAASALARWQADHVAAPAALQRSRSRRRHRPGLHRGRPAHGRPVGRDRRQGGLRQGGPGRGARRAGGPRRALGEGPTGAHAPGLVIGAVPERGDSRDALVGSRLVDLRDRWRSWPPVLPRRRAQLAPAPGRSRLCRAPRATWPPDSSAGRRLRRHRRGCRRVGAARPRRPHHRGAARCRCSSRRSARVRWRSSAAPMTTTRISLPGGDRPRRRAVVGSTPSGRSSPSSGGDCSLPAGAHAELVAGRRSSAGRAGCFGTGPGPASATRSVATTGPRWVARWRQSMRAALDGRPAALRRDRVPRRRRSR